MKYCGVSQAGAVTQTEKQSARFPSNIYGELVAGNCMMPSPACKSDNVLGSPSSHVCQALASCKLCISLVYQVLLFCPKLAVQQVLPVSPGLPCIVCAQLSRKGFYRYIIDLWNAHSLQKNSFPSQASVGPGTLQCCLHLADVSSWQVWYQIPAASLC